MLADGVPQEDTVIFCTRSRVAEAREGTGLLGALVGSWFSGLMERRPMSRIQTRTGCWTGL